MTTVRAAATALTAVAVALLVLQILSSKGAPSLCILCTRQQTATALWVLTTGQHMPAPHSTQEPGFGIEHVPDVALQALFCIRAGSAFVAPLQDHAPRAFDHSGATSLGAALASPAVDGGVTAVQAVVGQASQELLWMS